MVGRWADDGLLCSLRYLFVDFLHEEDQTPPFLPDGPPEVLRPSRRGALKRSLRLGS